MSNLTLFDLTNAIQDVVADIIDATIVGDKNEVEALEEELDSLYDSREHKMEGYVHLIKNMDALAKGCREEAKLFTARARAIDNFIARRKERVKADLVEHEEKSTPAGKFKIARHRNSVPTITVNISPELLPEEYQRIEVKADTDELRRAFKRGEKVEGVDMEIGEHIRIRVR